jgi:hypothetical protein
MSGWFSYQTRREFVDIELHQKNIANLKAWCQYHPQETGALSRSGNHIAAFS